jgi:uncharacterized circularly permuted ATP-grasp superfamily protein
VARDAYAPVLEALAGDAGGLAAGVEELTRSEGVTFGAAEDGLLALDPVPRLIDATEWQRVVRGVKQRADALERFLEDVYGEREIVAAAGVPERVISGSEHFEPAMRGARPPGLWISVIGFDVVRGADRRLRVLEDQIRMPSGIAYAAAAREIVSDVLPVEAPPRDEIAAGFSWLGGALRATAPPPAGDEPFVVLLSEGPGSAGWYEHVQISQRAGLELVTLADLEREGDDVVRRDGDSRRRVDVVYQRTREDRFTDAEGRPTAIGELLLEPCRAARVACVNAPGSGIGDDKLVHAYVEEMIRFYLREDPVLDSVESFDLATEAGRSAALAEPEGMVFKPRGEMGGEGVVVWADVGEAERAATLAEIERAPERMIAQRRVELSTHPTVCDGRLAPRRVDLRPYLIRSPDGEWAMPGGLTRVALQEGSLIVNSGQGGGVKDTWVLR